MKIINSEEIYIKNDSLSDKIFTEDSIFFDIETTGFSPLTSTLYMIGCAFRSGNNICIKQFFAENPKDESAVLIEFNNLLSSFKTIISFNGVGFDIPFLKAKCKQYSCKDIYNNFAYIDIFKQISSLKKILNLENYKQKTIEAFLGIQREDKFSGGELINVYQEFVKSPSQEGADFLLLHNYDDIVGMTELLPILSYSEILAGNFTIVGTDIKNYQAYSGEEKQELIITLSNAYDIPKHVSSKIGDYYLLIDNSTTTIRIPVINDELYFFYPNYKDYYYLPREDTAIHKSVAEYVDSNFREKCKASNCYTRKASIFIPQNREIMKPAFFKKYKDKTSYFELTEDFLDNKEKLTEYVLSIIELFSPKK